MPDIFTEFLIDVLHIMLELLDGPMDLESIKWTCYQLSNQPVINYSLYCVNVKLNTWNNLLG